MTSEGNILTLVRWVNKIGLLEVNEERNACYEVAHISTVYNCRIQQGGKLPCPSTRDPESLTPASRLIIDSVRSPKRDPKKFINEEINACYEVPHISTMYNYKIQ